MNVVATEVRIAYEAHGWRAPSRASNSREWAETQVPHARSEQRKALLPSTADTEQRVVGVQMG